MTSRAIRRDFLFFTSKRDLVTKSPPLYAALLETHDILAYSLGAVVLLHTAAALKHHYRLKDDVLRRMLPFALTR